MAERCEALIELNIKINRGKKGPYDCVMVPKKTEVFDYGIMFNAFQNLIYMYLDNTY